jgi:hypothetical protein
MGLNSVFKGLIISTLCGKEHISWRSSCSSSCHFIQPPGTSSSLDQNTFLSLFTKTSPYILPFMWQINLWYPHKMGGVHGAVVSGRVLKPSRVFNSWWGSLGFFINCIVLATPRCQQKWVPGMFPAGKCGQWVRLPCHLMCKLTRNCRSFNLLKPSGPVQVCTGIAGLLLKVSLNVFLGLMCEYGSGGIDLDFFDSVCKYSFYEIVVLHFLKVVIFIFLC